MSVSLHLRTDFVWFGESIVARRPRLVIIKCLHKDEQKFSSQHVKGRSIPLNIVMLGLNHNLVLENPEDGQLLAIYKYWYFWKLIGPSPSGTQTWVQADIRFEGIIIIVIIANRMVMHGRSYTAEWWNVDWSHDWHKKRLIILQIIIPQRNGEQILTGHQAHNIILNL